MRSKTIFGIISKCSKNFEKCLLIDADAICHVKWMQEISSISYIKNDQSVSDAFTEVKNSAYSMNCIAKSNETFKFSNI